MYICIYIYTYMHKHPPTHPPNYPPPSPTLAPPPPPTHTIMYSQDLAQVAAAQRQEILGGSRRLILKQFKDKLAQVGATYVCTYVCMYVCMYYTYILRPN
jgi:hypothetical protein